MSASIGEVPSPRQWSRVNEENFWEFSLVLARLGGGEVYDGGDVKWTCTAGPLFNRIFAARFDEDKANERIGELVGEFLSRGADALWITGPSTRPVDLGGRLEHCGFDHSADWAAMDVDLAAVEGSLEEPEGCRVVEVCDERTLADWADAMCAGFDRYADSRDATYQHFLRTGVGGELPLCHYLAYSDGLPSAACTVFLGSRTAGVYFVATIPSARRRGLASLVTRRGLEECRQRGYANAVLQASRMGEPLYRKMGFRRRAGMGLYSLNVQCRRS